MFLTTNLYRAVTEPPAHLLHILDHTAARREHPVGEDDIVIITEIQHHETRTKWQQAFILTLPVAARLTLDLMAHLENVALSHGSLRPTDDDPPM